MPLRTVEVEAVVELDGVLPTALLRSCVVESALGRGDLGTGLGCFRAPGLVVPLAPCRVDATEVADAAELLRGRRGFGPLGTALSAATPARDVRPAVAVLRAETAETLELVELVRFRRDAGDGEFGVDAGLRRAGEGVTSSELADLNVVDASLRDDMVDSGRLPPEAGGTARLAEVSLPLRMVEVLDLTDAIDGAMDFGRADGEVRGRSSGAPGVRGIAGVVGVLPGLVRA